MLSYTLCHLIDPAILFILKTDQPADRPTDIYQSDEALSIHYMMGNHDFHFYCFCVTEVTQRKVGIYLAHIFFYISSFFNFHHPFKRTNHLSELHDSTCTDFAITLFENFW